MLETEWETPDGTVRVVDFMPPRGEAPDVVRIVEGVSGRVPMRSELRLRFDYGRVVPWVRAVDGEIGRGRRPRRRLAATPAPWTTATRLATLEFAVVGRASGCRSCSPGTSLARPPRPSRSTPTPRWQHTEDFWPDWIGQLQLRRPLAGRRAPLR